MNTRLKTTWQIRTSPVADHGLPKVLTAISGGGLTQELATLNLQAKNIRGCKGYGKQN